MKQNGAELIVEFLSRAGVHTVAGIPGGSNLPLYDALQRSGIRHVLARHEQGAGFMAQGMARSTGFPGICLASSGPGATNLVTPLADAKMDSVPVLAITGQVATGLIGTDAFQEIDTIRMMQPVVKAAIRPKTIFELPEVLDRAWRICREGRPGPVVIDVPKDVQLAETEYRREQYRGNHFPDHESIRPSDVQRTRPVNPPLPDSQRTIADIAKRIHHSRRPILYVGGGIVHSGASDLLSRLAHLQQIPVALTLHGLGCFHPDDPLHLGMLGMHGNRSTNHAMEEADLVLAIGVRFDDRATGVTGSFAAGAQIVHVDIDPFEIGKLRSVDIGLPMDAREFLEVLLPQMQPASRERWRERVNTLRDTDDHFPREWNENPLHPVRVLRRIAESCHPDTIFTTDVGQHQMWAARYLPVRAARTFLTSGGLGTMGFGLPTAIGASLAHPDRPVVCLSGDGSLFMNIQELSTAAELRSNLKVIVFNNNHLGLVRQQQDFFYGKNFFASRFEHPADYGLVASAMGMTGINVMETDNVEEILRDFLSLPGPALLNLPINERLHVLPMVPPGKANVQAILSA